MRSRLLKLVSFSAFLTFSCSTVLFAGEAEAAPVISVFWVLPFIGILLCIAIIPLINAHFWEKNLWWISLGVFCVPMALIFSLFMGEQLRELTIEKALDYVSFILLLASLYVISGGILIKGSLAGTPKVNTVFILIGSVMAIFVGTTGASMLLIRPMIRANKDRKNKAHLIIFFIFLVSNIGGLLTPLGDPSLLLGYLQGIPFEWTFRLAPQWALACAIVLALFFAMDTFLYRRERGKKTAAAAPARNRDYVALAKKDVSAAIKILDIDSMRSEKKVSISDLKNARGKLTRALKSLENAPAFSAGPNLAIDGRVNIALVAGVVLIVFLQGLLIKKVSWWPRFGPQEAGMAILLFASLIVTPYKSTLRRENGFTFGPIREVALIFAGIFAAMIPALYILEHRGAALGITEPWQFFWATGGLSSILGNAPTYLTFLSLAKGLNLSRDIILNDGGHVSTMVLAAISCGAVFMGANSYIGNGTNYMVKSIAEEQGIKMPGFFGYMAYSMAILIPTFILITLIFFV